MVVPFWRCDQENEVPKVDTDQQSKLSESMNEESESINQGSQSTNQGSQSTNQGSQSMDQGSQSMDQEPKPLSQDIVGFVPSSLDPRKVIVYNQLE